VPQRRKRIFLVADFRGQCAGEILFKPEGLRWYPAESAATGERTSRSAENGTRAKVQCLTPWDVQSKRVYEGTGKWPPLYSGEGSGGAKGYAVVEGTLGIDGSAENNVGKTIGFRGDRNGLDASYNITPTLCADPGAGNGCKMSVAFGVGESGDVAHCLRSGASKADKHESTTYAVDILPFDTTQITSPQNGNKPEYGDPCHPLCATAHVPSIVEKVAFACSGFCNYEQGELAATQRAVMYKQTDVDLVVDVWDMTHADEVMRHVTGGKVQTLNARMGTGGNQVPVISYSIAGNTIDRKIKNGGNGKGVNEEVSFTLNTIDRHAVAYAFGSEDKNETGNTLLAKANLSYRRDMDNLAVAAVDVRNLNENKELSATLQAKSNGGYSLNYQNPVRVGYKVRRLTPTECERLQGLPDGWTAGGSDTQRYKALGNGMAQPCPDYVMQGIAEVLYADR